MPYSKVIDPAPGIRLWLEATEKGISRISFDSLVSVGPASPFLEAAAHQLEEYFLGRRREFDLPLDLNGTGFQRSVWAAVAGIPYGQTRSYADIARQVGSPKAVRAVGAANGANPIPIVVPCHRVIASSGKMGGYGGGLELKSRLLVLESGLLGCELADRLH